MKASLEVKPSIKREQELLMYSNKGKQNAD